MNDEFTYDRLVGIVNALLDIALEMGGVIAVGFIVYYGLRMTMAKGDPGKFTEAKKGLTLAIVGALVIFGVFTIVNTVERAVKGVGGPDQLPAGRKLPGLQQLP